MGGKHSRDVRHDPSPSSNALSDVDPVRPKFIGLHMKTIVGDRASQEVYDAVRLRLGLDKPLVEQYLNRGDRVYACCRAPGKAEKLVAGMNEDQRISYTLGFVVMHRIFDRARPRYI